MDEDADVLLAEETGLSRSPRSKITSTLTLTLGTTTTSNATPKSKWQVTKEAWLSEFYDLLHLSIPMAISRVSWVGMKTTDTGLVGHTKTLYLEASALSDLWTQSTACVLSGGVLGMFASQVPAQISHFCIQIFYASVFSIILISILIFR